MQHPQGITTAIGLALLAPFARAQTPTSFTIENHGPSISAPDAFSSFPITEGDVLTPATGPAFVTNPCMPAPPIPPGILISGGAIGPPGPGLGLLGHAGCVGHPPGVPCPIEVDALSYGTDFPLPMGPTPAGTFWFSVDEYAAGFPTNPVPNVFSEGLTGVDLEAAADAFIDLGTPTAGPFGPFTIPMVGNVGALDGDGLPNFSGFTYPGFGVAEPDPPGLPPDFGDNVDGMDVDDPLATYPVYFSLDAAYLDPINAHPLSGTAAFHMVSPGDVLVTTVPGGPPTVYAFAGQLGLEAQVDDLDALALWENGDGVYQPSATPYDWLTGATDMLLFSVRRGSPIIGTLDSIFAQPIEEGDILTTPVAGGPPVPGIFLAAENVGLMTLRSFPGINFADDLDALDVVLGPLFDCNANGVEDAYDINSGSSTDINRNGIPDDCELVSSTYCFCPAAVAICSNPDPNAGCANSTGSGSLLSATGTSSVVNDDMTLVATQGVPNVFGLFFMGATQVNNPFGDGRRCAGGFAQRFNPPMPANAAGGFSRGPIVGLSLSFPPAAVIVSGATWNFQYWYRDQAGPCGNTFNLSNGLSVTFTP